jgi:hypothetical protein
MIYSYFQYIEMASIFTRLQHIKKCPHERNFMCVEWRLSLSGLDLHRRSYAINIPLNFQRLFFCLYTACSMMHYCAATEHNARSVALGPVNRALSQLTQECVA